MTDRVSRDQHPITPADALRFGQSMCAQAGSDTPRLDAEVLLRHVLGIDRTRLFAEMNETIDPDKAADFLTLLGRRVAGEPIAYLTGEREFHGRPFKVGEGVLIPGPRRSFSSSGRATGFGIVPEPRSSTSERAAARLRSRLRRSSARVGPAGSSESTHRPKRSPGRGATGPRSAWTGR